MSSQMQRNPQNYHDYLISKYVKKDRQVDTSKWKTDQDVIRENLKFIWDESEVPETWEERLAKKYYDKLFKEYCICDLSRYKENLIANRFRVEQEVVSGKGQFSCAEKRCKQEEGLRTWEVNFSYSEAGSKKNALVKLRLCPECSDKLNYHTKKREIKRLAKQSSKRKTTKSPSKRDSRAPTAESEAPPDKLASEEPQQLPNHSHSTQADESLWKHNDESELKGRDEEFDEYLADLLL